MGKDKGVLTRGRRKLLEIAHEAEIDALKSKLDELLLHVQGCTCKGSGGSIDKCGVDMGSVADSSVMGAGDVSVDAGTGGRNVNVASDAVVEGGECAVEARGGPVRGGVGAGDGKDQNVDMGVTLGSDNQQEGKTTVVSSYAQTVLKGSDIKTQEPEYLKNKVEGKPKLAQDGVWRCVGGSRFWRPSVKGNKVEASVSSEDEGHWSKQGNSRVWRRSDDVAQGDGGWTRVRGGAKSNSMADSHTVEVSNMFSVLESETQSQGDDTEVVRHLVVGDSRVRPFRRTFCDRKDKCIVKPGAKVEDIDRVVETELRRCTPEVIIVQVGVNNVGPRKSEKILSDYRSLLQRLQNSRKPVIVTGILPRLSGVGNEWYSRAISLNSSVKSLCKDMGLKFVDLWDDFFDGNGYYLRDGLHLSDEGARVLGAVYRQLIQGN